MNAHVIDQLKNLGPTIKEISRITGAPGLSLGVQHRGEIIHTANYGHRNIEDSIPPDSDTIYGLGSITKIFTASAVGALVHEGKLQWTTPLRTILPDLDSTDEFINQRLTIVDLLTHRIGLEKSNYWWFGSNGVLLLDKNQTLKSFNALKQISTFREKFDYTNWGFALAGEVIEKLSGMSFGKYIESRVLNPLKLQRTTTRHFSPEIDNFAKPYAALDDGSMYPLEPPAIQDGEIMVAAQGVQSCVNDLLKFSSSLMKARKGEVSPLKNTAKQFCGHIFRADSLLDKSYGLGFMRNLLPGTIGGGCNAMFGELPTITPGGDARLVVSHGGSQAGYTSFLTMLPEIDVSLVVLTNSVGLSDPAGWVNELLIETIVESPHHTDFVKLARDAAQKHIASYPAMERKLEEHRASSKPPKPLSRYLGQYVNSAHSFLVEIRLKDPVTLQIAFQGLDSQLWDLRHYQDDTFLWLSSRDEQAKRARFTYSPASVYKIIFSSDSEESITGLYWPHDPSLPEKEQWFEKSGAQNLGVDSKTFKQR